MKASAVKFELASDVDAVRVCVGGSEISIDRGGSYSTANAAEIKALDQLAGVKRAAKTAAKAKTVKAPAKRPAEAVTA